MSETEVTKNNPHIGSTFESWLDEAGIRAEVTASAVKAVLAAQLVREMKARGLTKTAMASAMKTSRAQLDRLLDPHEPGLTLDTLHRAAMAVGKQVRIELV